MVEGLFGGIALLLFTAGRPLSTGYPCRHHRDVWYAFAMTGLVALKDF
jgi:hypothetical protein